jgi:trehalose 6-phosphate synthase
VDTEHARIRRGGHDTFVRPFPISIDFANYHRRAGSTAVSSETARWYAELGCQPEILGIGIDRIDYTKGIPERLEAIDRLLELHPEYIGRLTFVQVGVPSRTAITAYHDLNAEVGGLIDRINSRWGRTRWRPIVFIHRHVDQSALITLNLMADFCAVTSLHDGMNLVAKEFVASRIDEDGVLVLSAFTGAARELGDALIVNPFSIDEIAAAMHRAINMPVEERRRRMTRMRHVVVEHNVYRWAGKILTTLARLHNEGETASPSQCTLEALARGGGQSEGPVDVLARI